MATTASLPYGLTRYHITRKADGQTFSVVAHSIGMAWRKFSAQRFGLLKPSKAEYRIRAER